MLKTPDHTSQAQERLHQSSNSTNENAFIFGPCSGFAMRCGGFRGPRHDAPTTSTDTTHVGSREARRILRAASWLTKRKQNSTKYNIHAAAPAGAGPVVESARDGPHRLAARAGGAAPAGVSGAVEEAPVAATRRSSSHHAAAAGAASSARGPPSPSHARVGRLVDEDRLI